MDGSGSDHEAHALLHGLLYGLGLTAVTAALAFVRLRRRRHLRTAG